MIEPKTPHLSNIEMWQEWKENGNIDAKKTID